MNTKKEIKFPNGFFTQSRSTVSTKETLKDVIPIKWSKEVMSSKKRQLSTRLKRKNHNNKYFVFTRKRVIITNHSL